MGWEKAFSIFFLVRCCYLSMISFNQETLQLHQSTNTHHFLFFFFGGGIKTIPWAYVRQKNPVGTSGIHPPGRHAVQRGQPSTCSSAEALPWDVPSWLVRVLEVWTNLSTVPRSVSMNTRSNERNRFVNGKKKTAHIFFCVCLW